MLQLQTVFPYTLELLNELSPRPEMSGLRLVGDTALALQYGHRQSIDLDFFGSLAVEQDDIIEVFSSMGSFTIHNRTKRILQGALSFCSIIPCLKCWTSTHRSIPIIPSSVHFSA